MKILLIADKAEPTLWEHLDKRKLEGVELVLSCGDLPASYLSFLTCFTPAPILYIHGQPRRPVRLRTAGGLHLYRRYHIHLQRHPHPRTGRLHAL